MNRKRPIVRAALAGIALVWTSGLALRAQATPEALAPGQACRQLQAEAAQLLGHEAALRCAPSGERLVVHGASQAAIERAAEALFPARKFRGFDVAVENTGADLAAAQPSVEKAAVARSFASPAALNAAVEKVNFDGSTWGNSAFGLRDAVADSLMLAQSGPPGSGGNTLTPPPGMDSSPQRSGPPGSGNNSTGPSISRGGPPGSSGAVSGPPGGGHGPVSKGPPGSGMGGSHGGPPGSGGGVSTPPPGGSAPPSRTPPVWRDNFPPPPPNWWNTQTWDHYQWWDDLPANYGRPYSDPVNENLYRYYSGWQPHNSLFHSEWGNTSDTETIVRTGPAHSETKTLSSQQYRDQKQCYYRAVYRYTWEEGGFHGSHWEESFDHWEARCIRRPRFHGPTTSVTVTVEFDMSQAQRLPNGNLDLPWQRDVVRLSYSGANVTVDQSEAAFHYDETATRRNRQETLTLAAGARRKIAPEHDKVTAVMVNDGGRLKLKVSDGRADYYAGETLEITIEIWKVQPWHWRNNPLGRDAKVFERASNGPIRITVDPSSPEQTIDLGVSGKGEYYIDSWSFRRAGSAVSTERWMSRGKGNRVTMQ